METVIHMQTTVYTIFIVKNNLLKTPNVWF